MFRFNFALVLLLFSHGPALRAADSAWKPEKNVEIVIAAAAAGANDRIGRAIQRVLQETKLVPTSVSVVNKPGGGQNIAVTYLSSHPGDAHFLMLASASWFTTVAGGRGSISYKDVTPIIRLFDEYQVYYTQADSPIKSGRDLGERLKKDVSSVSFGFSTALGNPLHISIANLARVVGADPKKIKTVNWEETLLKVTQAPEIKKDMERNLWSVEPITGRELISFLDQQHDNMRRTLTELGLTK